MTGNLFWLPDEAWAALEPHLPKNQPGKLRVDDRWVISGILHMLKTGGRWRDVPPEYGPAKTIYGRNRRLWKDAETTITSSTGFLHAAAANVLVRRIASAE